MKALLDIPTEAEPDLLVDVGPLLSREINLDRFLQLLVDRVAALMEADRGTLYLLDPARKELFSRAAHLPELRQIRLGIGQGVAGYVAAEGVMVNVPDPSGERHFFAEIDRLTGYRTTSLLAAPLRDAKGELFGVLQVLNRRGTPRFTEDDEQRFERITSQAARALEATSLHAELERAKSQPSAPVGWFFNRIIGESAPMRELYARIQKAAPTDATVLLGGESGTGKELFARALHVNGSRRDRPFVKVDCAALPASLIENELFGHEKGAFTGAVGRVEGKFEAADGGTVFIDEIGELPLSAQGKLLRVLQDRAFERVGGTQTRNVDVRIIAATHRDLARLVAEGGFREDLYYRIRVVELKLPPLRERGPEDLERLARHFVQAAARKHRPNSPPRLTEGALERLRRHTWPGNVRELEHCIESAVVLSESEIRAEDLPLPSRTEQGSATARPPLPGLVTLAEAERAHVLHVMEALNGNRSAAARTLGIGRNTLARKLREYGLD